MDKYKNILFENPRPFIIAQLENNRLIINETNKQITEIEEICKQNNKLLASVEKLALNMENMHHKYHSEPTRRYL